MAWKCYLLKTGFKVAVFKNKKHFTKLQTFVMENGDVMRMVLRVQSIGMHIYI